MTVLAFPTPSPLHPPPERPPTPSPEPEAPPPLGPFLGTSPATLEIARLLPKLARSSVPVLLEGETGVGKTFVARALHEGGPRASSPLHVLNCAAIPEGLLESELFGTERGAFTGALVARPGAFEAAGRGTLLLDEIGELSLVSQAKLLRVLEERRFERLGSTRPIELRARVVCATNRDLTAMAEEGLFRRDLLFRISVVRLHVPPLRARGDDVLALARHLLDSVCRHAQVDCAELASDAIDAIRRYAWPGNVRELRSALEHAVALRDGATLHAADLPALVRPARPADDRDTGALQLPCDLATLERRAIEAALTSTNGNRVKASAILGINRATLYNKLKAYDDASAHK